MKAPLLYFSTTTTLANLIAKNFFNDTYFVWCSPVFDPTKSESHDIRSRIPASSSPLYKYKEYQRCIDPPDLHALQIKEHKKGLKKGALAKYNNGDITEPELQRINQLINNSSINEFKPLMYIIPHSVVAKKIKRVDSKDAAHPFSEEYKITELKREEFEIIEF